MAGGGVSGFSLVFSFCVCKEYEEEYDDEEYDE